MLKSPTTKAEFLNRLLQFDFSGFGSLGATSVQRVANNIIQVALPTGVYRLVIQRPKPEAARAAARERWQKQFGGKLKHPTKRKTRKQPKAPSKEQTPQPAVH